MIIKKKLSKKGVKAYEKASGFKTNGKVDLYMVDDKTYGLIGKLYAPLDKAS